MDPAVKEDKHYVIKAKTKSFDSLEKACALYKSMHRNIRTSSPSEIKTIKLFSGFTSPFNQYQANSFRP
jgi:hypothetical protein